MKVNKNMAIYKYLPNTWISYNDSNNSKNNVACFTTAWNVAKVENINKVMLQKDICRRAASFKAAGGDISSQFEEENVSNLVFVKAAMNEGIEDIKCEMNPKTFYCGDPKCGYVYYNKYANDIPKCPKCGKKMKQLEYVYACSCGYASGIVPKFTKEDLYFKPRTSNEYDFIDKHGTKVPNIKVCPVCGKVLLPKNASDPTIFYSQSGSVVNLYNDDYSNVIKKYGTKGQLLILAKWLKIITHEQFLEIVEDPKPFFEGESELHLDPSVLETLNGLPQPIRKKFLQQFTEAYNSNKLTFDSVNTKINNLVALENLQRDKDLLTSKLIEHDILEYPKDEILLDSAIDKNIQTGACIDASDIKSLLSKMKIKDIKVPQYVQILNYAYGYTRLRSRPDLAVTRDKIKLNGFANNNVFVNLLNTEGLLVHLDLKEVYNWLVDNNIIEDDLAEKDEITLREWFIEKVNLEEVVTFKEIDWIGNSLITKAVYSLVHTIAHLMIKSAGKNSGLGKDSLSEMLFPNTCSFFIYPTTTEGVTLGSISGMFETNLLSFLEDTLSDFEICTFDPICAKHENGACMACTYLSEVSCDHFNKDLSRSYLYGGTLKFRKDESIEEPNMIFEVKKGFWK